MLGFTVNDGEKSRLQSEVSRLKNKLSEGETRSNVLQSRLKELQADLSTTRKKLETTQNNNKDLRQQVLRSWISLKQEGSIFTYCFQLDSFVTAIVLHWCYIIGGLLMKCLLTRFSRIIIMGMFTPIIWSYPLINM